MAAKWQNVTNKIDKITLYKQTIVVGVEAICGRTKPIIYCLIIYIPSLRLSVVLSSLNYQ